jgi:hypothetical protein
MRVALVLDDSPTMCLWARRLREVEAVVRTTQDVVRVVPLGDYVPEEGVEPVVVTDGVDVSWADGRMARRLRDLRIDQPVVLVTTPFCLWPRSPLGRQESRGTCAAGVVSYVRYFGDREPCFPVLLAEDEHVSGALEAKYSAQAKWLCAFLSLAEEPPAPQVEVDPKIRVQSFRNSSAPDTRRLAAVLSYVVDLDVDVIHEVRTKIFPGMTFADEVGVILGGVLKRKSDDLRDLMMLPEARDVLRWEARVADIQRLKRVVPNLIEGTP